MNYGASYQVADGVTLGLDWLYGRSIGGNISFQLDPTRPQYPAKLDTPPPPVAVRKLEEQQLALQAMLQSDRGDRISTANPARAAPLLSMPYGASMDSKSAS